MQYGTVPFCSTILFLFFGLKTTGLPCWITWNMCRNQADPKPHWATGGGLTVIMQSYLASRRQARPPSPLILGFWKTFLYNRSGAPDRYTFVQIVVSHPASLHQFSSRLIPKECPAEETPCRKVFILIAFLLSSLTPHFSFLMFSYISLASYPFFSVLSVFPQFIYIYIYICVQHRIFVRIWIQRVEHR